ncbi:hypothetical protein OF829_13945 [Sphingomonas sp. LB-2]|uniref:hypothetical protein n=1 Tax=Sphingomonas caeni TaxID=2984949 RepID=UPI00222E10B6|nr:hypothetical protein [Sphingomonas caeni]MCW3848343.1 hypothetical protein [Sphingomonas caeni]
MKAFPNPVLAAALVGAAMLCGSPAAAQSGTVDTLLARADEVYDQHGYVKQGWERQSLLKQGGEESFTITLTGGHEYSLIGVCDRDCENLDLYVTDEKGVEVTKDVEDDDYPVVYIKRGGTLTLRVRAVMTKCSDAPCEYGIKAYRM